MISRQDWRDAVAAMNRPRIVSLSWRVGLLPFWPILLGFAPWCVGVAMPTLAAGDVGVRTALGLAAVVVSALGFLRGMIVVAARGHRAHVAATLRRPCPWCGQGEEDDAAAKEG